MRNPHKSTPKLCINFLFIKRSMSVMSWWIKKVLLLYVPTKIGGLLEWKPLIWKFARLYVVINGEVINGECAPSMEHSRKLDWICYIPQPASQGTRRGLLVSSLYCQHPSQIVPGYILFNYYFCFFFFSPSSENKSWEMKELHMSRALPLTGRAGSGQFISRFVFSGTSPSVLSIPSRLP